MGKFDLVLCSSMLVFLPLIGLQSQDLPVTHIYLVEAQVDSTGSKVASISLLTNDNPEGYNNQPAVVGKMVYYSRRLPSQEQNEIYAIDLEKQKKIRITNTIQSEYSPIPHPNLEEFSCVRVEEDNTTQVIWNYPIDRSHGGRPASLEILDAGYYDWKNENELTYFKVTEPSELRHVTFNAEQDKTIASSVGRTIKWMGDGTLAYIHIFSEDYRYIKRYIPESTDEPKIIVQLPNESTDFGYAGNQTYYTGKGTQLLKFVEGKDVGWIEFLDLSSFGLEKITRITCLDELTWLLVDEKGMDE